MRAILAVIFKELILFFRSKGLVFFVLYAFTMEIYISGTSFELKPKNVAVGYVDYTDGTPVVNEIIHSLRKPEFKKPVPYPDEKSLEKAIYEGEITAGLIFPADFEEKLFRGETAQIELYLDATSAGQSFLTYGYIAKMLLHKFSEQKLRIKFKKLFNPNGDTKYYTPLSEMVSVATLLGIVLSAAFFVREKEENTWEITLTQPVDIRLVVFAKLLAQTVVLTLSVLISLGLVLFGIFDIPFKGSFFLFLLFTVVYAMAMGGIGLFVAAVTDSMLGVALLTILILLPMTYLSGNWTPPQTMEPATRLLSHLSPLNYYYDAVRHLFFIGDRLFVLKDLTALTVMSLLLVVFGMNRLQRLN